MRNRRPLILPAKPLKRVGEPQKDWTVEGGGVGVAVVKQILVMMVAVVLVGCGELKEDGEY